MWVTNPKTQKLIDKLYTMSRKYQLDPEEEQALWISRYIIELHRAETEKAIKLNMQAVKKLNRFGIFLRRWVKIVEEVK